MWSILVSSEKGGALVPSHLHDRSVAQHLLNCCSKPKPSSIAETCLILINLVFTWFHMQMSPLCCGWTSLRNYGRHHFRFLLLWSPGSALTIDGTGELENTCMASKSQCSKSLLWKHSLYAKMRIWRMLEQLLLYSFFLSIKEDNFLPSFMTQSLARLIPFIFLVNWDLRTRLITLLDAVRGNSGTTATALTCTTFNNFSRSCSHETTEIREKETWTLHFLTFPLSEVLYSPVKICCCCLLRCP